MSLKAIEMQIAIPRTIEASKLYDQQMHRGQLTNEYGNMAMQQEEVKQRTTVVKQEQKDPAQFHHNQENSHERSKQEEMDKQKSKPKKERPIEKHPYKGNFLDYSG